MDTSSRQLENRVELEADPQHATDNLQPLRPFHAPSNGLVSRERQLLYGTRPLLIPAAFIIATTLCVVLAYRGSANDIVSRLLRIDLFKNETSALHHVIFALQFVPTASAAVTSDYAYGNSNPRVFAPGRLILRPAAESLVVATHIDPCVLSAAARAIIERSIHAAVVAQHSPQCLQTCRVDLPPPQLQCPAAMLRFLLPNSMLLPAGAPLFELAAVAAINGTVGLPFVQAFMASTVLSLDAARSSVVVMQVT
jgi:hypothetical protein